MKKIDNALRIFLLHITTFAALNEKDGIKAKVFKMYTSSCIPRNMFGREKKSKHYVISDHYINCFMKLHKHFCEITSKGTWVTCI